MPSIRLIPSSYSVSNTTYVSGTNISNMYNNVDNSSYATFTNNRTSTTSYYIYIRGFNLGDVPANAIINSFTLKVKGYESGVSTSTSYAPRIVNDTSIIANTTATSTFGTSSKIITIPTGSLTWQNIVNYGSNFGIQTCIRRNNRNTTAYLYIQGAELEVDYTIPVYHNITVNGENVEPSGVSSILEGESFSLKCFYDEKPKVTDNGIDVSDYLIETQDSPESYSVENITTSYGFELNSNEYYESNNAGYSNTSAVCKVNFYLPVSGIITFSVINYAESGYDFGLLSDIDETLSTSANADSSNVYWSGSSHNSSSVQTVTYNMDAGEHFIYVKYFKDQYTDDYNDSFQFKVSIELSETPIYAPYYLYTINSIAEEHIITVENNSAKAVYVKINNEWILVKKVYKKINNLWLEQDNLNDIFHSGINYVKKTPFFTLNSSIDGILNVNILN